MNCPVCGQMATEYDEGKWQCLSPRCQIKFLYEKPSSVKEVRSIVEASASPDPSEPSPHRYRVVSPWAVMSVACAVASATMFYPFEWLASPFPLAAIYFGLKALGQIQRAPEEYSGQRLARLGIRLAVVLGISLSGWLTFGGSEVPHGYQVLDYADLEPDPNKKEERVPASALALSDNKTKVYARGYIVPGRRQLRLTEFSICRTSDQCRFANKSNRPTDSIHIELTGDRTIDYTSHQIGVGGIFHVDLDSPHGTPYSIIADYVYP